MIRSLRNRIDNLQPVFHLSKAYLIPAMVKFPLVISKNGVLNGFVAIFIIGGVLSSISNFLLAKISQKTNIKSYSNISKKLLGNKTNSSIQFISFLFRCVVSCYSVDLNFKFLKSAIMLNLPDFELSMILGTLLLLSTFLFSNPNSFWLGRHRNFFNFILLGSVTSFFLMKNFNININKIDFENKSENPFDSLGLTLLCFSQQLGLVELLSNEKLQGELQLILGGSIASLSYIAIGIAGYISITDPNVNYLSDIDINSIKSISSIILLLSNILNFPVLIGPIKNDIQNLNIIQKESILNILLTTFFVLTSVKFVASTYAIKICVVLSSFIMMIFPSIFYMKIFERNVIQARLLLVVGIFILTIGIKQLIS